eukprot:8910217-Pyramimonas_sp.AAC.1
MRRSAAFRRRRNPQESLVSLPRGPHPRPAVRQDQKAITKPVVGLTMEGRRPTGASCFGRGLYTLRSQEERVAAADRPCQITDHCFARSCLLYLEDGGTLGHALHLGFDARDLRLVLRARQPRAPHDLQPVLEQQLHQLELVNVQQQHQLVLDVVLLALLPQTWYIPSVRTKCRRGGSIYPA